jgi:hypothetical protein
MVPTGITAECVRELLTLIDGMSDAQGRLHKLANQPVPSFPGTEADLPRQVRKWRDEQMGPDLLRYRKTVAELQQCAEPAIVAAESVGLEGLRIKRLVAEFVSFVGFALPYGPFVVDGKNELERLELRLRGQPQRPSQQAGDVVADRAGVGPRLLWLKWFLDNDPDASLREIEAAAKDSGHHLPRSSINGILNRHGWIGHPPRFRARKPKSTDPTTLQAIATEHDAKRRHVP